MDRPSRPRLYTRRHAPPDPRGLRARHPARPPVQRDDRLLGDAGLRASPCVAVAVRDDRYTHDLILESSTFALSILRDDQVDVATHFSDTSGEYHDKLQGVPYGLTPAARRSSWTAWPTSTAGSWTPSAPGTTRSSSARSPQARPWPTATPYLRSNRVRGGPALDLPEPEARLRELGLELPAVPSPPAPTSPRPVPRTSSSPQASSPSRRASSAIPARSATPSRRRSLRSRPALRAKRPRRRRCRGRRSERDKPRRKGDRLRRLSPRLQRPAAGRQRSLRAYRRAIRRGRPPRPLRRGRRRVAARRPRRGGANSRARSLEHTTLPAPGRRSSRFKICLIGYSFCTCTTRRE